MKKKLLNIKKKIYIDKKTKEKEIACRLLKVWINFIKRVRVKMNNIYLKMIQGTPMCSKIHLYSSICILQLLKKIFEKNGVK